MKCSEFVKIVKEKVVHYDSIDREIEKIYVGPELYHSIIDEYYTHGLYSVYSIYSSNVNTIKKPLTFNMHGVKIAGSYSRSIKNYKIKLKPLPKMIYPEGQDHYPVYSYEDFKKEVLGF